MTATSDTDETTEYIDLVLANPTAADIREGDRVTFTHDSFPTTGEIRATAYPYFHDQDLRAADFQLDHPRLHVLRVERPVPALPTRPWALVVPLAWSADAVYLLHESGDWADELGNRKSPRTVWAALAEGTHYVAFEGVES